MNLLLLRPHELRADGTASVRGRRAVHLRAVLGVVPGSRLRAGILEGGLGEAEVLAVAADSVRLRCRIDPEPLPRGDDTLLLAVPRPKVLLRMLEHAAALGLAHLVLLRTWRVDKSHLLARALTPEAWRPRLLAGLEQAGRTRVPVVRTEARFRPFVEDRLDASVPAGNRFVAHPAAATPVWRAPVARGPLTLALGPEGGFLPWEVEQLAARGFTPVHAGPHPVRVETALPLLLGQLTLLRQRA